MIDKEDNAPTFNMSTTAGSTRSHSRSQTSRRPSANSSRARSSRSTTPAATLDTSSDLEISFKTVDKAPTSMLGSDFDLSRSHRTRHSTAKSYHSTGSGSVHSLSGSAIFRLDTLESDVNTMRSDLQGVKASMEGVNLQLAILVSAAQKEDKSSQGYRQTTSLHPPHDANRSVVTPSVYAQPSDSHLITTGGQPDNNTPLPADLRKAATVSGFIDANLRREEMAHVKSEGKNPFTSDIFTDKLIGKPYMFIQRDGVRTLKDKLDVRGSMKSGEYINALIALLQKPAAFDVEHMQHMQRHLHEVSSDSLTRSWKNVMAWSQHIFDEVEKKNLFWNEYQLIQNARFRLCFAPVDQESTTHVPYSNQQTTSSGGKIIVSCPDFNLAKGCKHRGHHEVTGIKLLHVCAFCLSRGKELPHNIIACNNKMFGSTHTHQPAAQPTSRGAVQSNVYTPNQQQVAKN